MGRQGPLTALALGRSPYDDVVQGDGDGGEGESSSTQQYDEKGRPINPETKRLNREIVRSHNEVMHVIGVAEPDPNSNESEVQSARRYLLYEHLIADRMETIANGLSDIAYWTFAGIRHRIMVRPAQVYKSFSSEPFWNLARVCWREVPRPFSSLFLAGFPTELAWQSFEFLQIKYIRERYRPNVLRRIITSDLATKIYFKLPHIDAIVDPRSHRDMLPGQAVPGAEEAGATQQARTEGLEEDSAAPPSGVSRRPSAFSGRGDDYGSDEEDNGAISGTLISFDVEATESTDAPRASGRPSSAPQRATTGDLPTGARQTTSRTRLPSNPSHTRQRYWEGPRRRCSSPAGSYRYAHDGTILRGAPRVADGDIWEPFLLGTTSWRWVANYLAVDFVQLMLQSDIWAGVTYLGRSYHLTPEQWTSMTPEQHVELVRDREWEE
ncbi:unnamed protein product [Parascedosporium putredinis]|uniref:Uncharacterized protein n=1 Tax=Parascedosporium putredinis TaxID=1442378 RepID=A0A9P1H1N2_9PEZI|nr:unnamed protein product [Parascedosporium putredinis]CAI7992929.1 unnamed protein product [Parascedosporium putredinis]